MYTVDETLPNNVRSFVATGFRVLSILLVIVYSTPLFATVIMPLTVLYILAQRFYAITSRQVWSNSIVFYLFSLEVAVAWTSIMRDWVSRNTCVKIGCA